VGEERLILKFTLTIIFEDLNYVANMHRFETPNSHPELNTVHLEMAILAANGHNTEPACFKGVANL
jgi:hypothetical protein